MRNIEKINHYLQHTLKFNSAQIQWEIKRFERHEDIAEELCRYIINGKFTEPEILVEGFSARMLCEKYPNEIPRAYDAYAMLILLRESPKATLMLIESGFPIE